MRQETPFSANSPAAHIQAPHRVQQNSETQSNQHPPTPTQAKEPAMAKGQQKTNKEAKKPKKDTSPPKAPSGGEPVRATITTAVIPRGKIKNK